MGIVPVRGRVSGKGPGVRNAPTLPEPRIASGPDFGFRIEADQKGTPIGKLVIRVDGKWIEARVAAVPGVRPVRPE